MLKQTNEVKTTKHMQASISTKTKPNSQLLANKFTDSDIGIYHTATNK